MQGEHRGEGIEAGGRGKDLLLETVEPGGDGLNGLDGVRRINSTRLNLFKLVTYGGGKVLCLLFNVLL